MKRSCFRVIHSVFSLLLLISISTGIPFGIALADPAGMPSQEELKAKIRPQLPSHLEMTDIEMSNVKSKGNSAMSMISANLLVHAKLKEAMYRADGVQDGKIRLFLTHQAGEKTILNASLIAVIPGGLMGQGQGQVRVMLLPGKGLEGQPLSFYQPNSYVIADDKAATTTAAAPAEPSTSTKATPSKTTPIVTASPATKTPAQQVIEKSASTPGWLTQLLAFQKSTGEVWGKTQGNQRNVGANAAIVLKQIKQTSANMITGIISYPFAGRQLSFNGRVTANQLVLSEKSDGKVRANSYMLFFDKDKQLLKGALLIPLTAAANKKLRAELEHHLKPWGDDKEMASLLLYGKELWNIDTKQRLDENWNSGFLRPVADLPGRYWSAQDWGQTIAPFGALRPERTYDPAGVEPLIPFINTRADNVWVSPNHHTFLKLKDGDLWRGEIDWSNGSIKSEVNVTKLGLLTFVKPVTWYGDDFYLRREQATDKPIVKVNIKTGAITEMKVRPAFKTASASSNGRYVFSSNGSDGLLYVYDAKTGEEFTLEATQYRRPNGIILNERPRPMSVQPVYWINGHTFYCDLGWYDLAKRERLVVETLPAVVKDIPAQITRKRYVLIPGGVYIDISFEGYQTDSMGVAIPDKRIYKRYRVNRLTKETLPLPLELKYTEAQTNRYKPYVEYPVTWIDENRYVFARPTGGLSEVGTWVYDLRTKKHTRISGHISQGGGINPLFVPGQNFDFMVPSREMNNYLIFPDKNKVGFYVKMNKKKFEYNIVSLDGKDTLVLTNSNSKFANRAYISRLVPSPIRLLTK